MPSISPSLTKKPVSAMHHGIHNPCMGVLTTGNPAAPASRIPTGVPSESPDFGTNECWTERRAFTHQLRQLIMLRGTLKGDCMLNMQGP